MAERSAATDPTDDFGLTLDFGLWTLDCSQLIVESPSGTRTIRVSRQTAARDSLAQILRREGLPLNTRCGLRGLCDGCVIELISGQLASTHGGRASVQEGDLPKTIRACEHHLTEPAAVHLRIPERALLAYAPHVVADFALNITQAFDPIVPVDPDTDALTLGIAIDVGTTTVVVLLVDLRSGDVLAETVDFNRQIHLGDDVLTRINLCRTDPKHLDELHRAVVDDTIVPLIDQALARASAKRSDVAAVTVAGNTTMLHLLAGVDPSPMGAVPFTPAFLEHRTIPNLAVDLPRCDLLPGAAAYVGADLVAGAFASALAYNDGPCLLVDVGTNGEIIAKYDHHLLGCATAAGPAFEGAGLTDGLRAGDGAISHVKLTADPFTIDSEVIGDDPATKPVGLCGTAYVDLLAECRRIGLLSPTGHFDVKAVPGAAAYLDPNVGHSPALRVAVGSGGRAVHFAETDVAALMQAKAAIAAGILTLLDRLHMTPADVKTLYLAGGFGMHMNVDSAIACGLLPRFRRDQVQLVGNTSLAGAYLTLTDKTVLHELTHIAQRMQVIELNLEPTFEDHFIDQLCLPPPEDPRK